MLLVHINGSPLERPLVVHRQEKKKQTAGNVEVRKAFSLHADRY